MHGQCGPSQRIFAAAGNVVGGSNGPGSVTVLDTQLHKHRGQLRASKRTTRTIVQQKVATGEAL